MNCTYIRIEKSSHVLSRARNIGAYWAEQTFGKSDHVCFLDNDVYLMPGWLSKLVEVEAKTHVEILGGCQHPYHGTNRELEGGAVHLVDAVAGYSMFMTRQTWKTYGPFPHTAPGVCQGEDNALCREVWRCGGRVGYVNPPVLLHCGITNSEGKPAVGSEKFVRVPGVLYE